MRPVRLSLRLPPDLLVAVRLHVERPNRSAFVVRAIANELLREGIQAPLPRRNRKVG